MALLKDTYKWLSSFFGIYIYMCVCVCGPAEWFDGEDHKKANIGLIQNFISF